MPLPHKEKGYWLNFLIAEKTRIESKVRTIESIEAATWIGMISAVITVASVVLTKGITLREILIPVTLAFPFIMCWVALDTKKDKLTNIRDSYASLIWSIITGEEINLEDIGNKVKRLQKDEKEPLKMKELLLKMKELLLKMWELKDR